MSAAWKVTLRPHELCEPPCADNVWVALEVCDDDGASRPGTVAEQSELLELIRGDEVFSAAGAIGSDPVEDYDVWVGLSRKPLGLGAWSHVGRLAEVLLAGGVGCVSIKAGAPRGAPEGGLA